LLVSPATRWVLLPAGGAMPVHLVRFEPAGFHPGYFMAAGLACPPEIARSAPRRQAEFFFGRVAARAALRALDAPTSTIPIGLGRQPVWPDGVVGSISHTATLAAAIVGARSTYAGLGIDVERVATAQNEDALRSVALDAEEVAILRTHAGPKPLRELVTLAFSAKESLYKCAFESVGRFFDFRSARVCALNPGTIELTLEEHLGPRFPRGRRFCIAFHRLDVATLMTVCEDRREGLDAAEITPL
jgi:enterobactin synthetase component D